MKWLIRPARANDIDALHGFAALTGGGMTNLPNDKDALARRLDISLKCFAKTISAPDDEVYILVLEEQESKRVLGTSAVFSRIGATWPFYNYKLTQMDQFASALQRRISATVLYLATDMSGTTEVGGLFLHPDARKSGVAQLLARSRYLFIAQHRHLFCDQTIAEMRGTIGPDGEAPFWSAVGENFFHMTFKEADHYNSLHGNQFISDLMPKHPIYVSLLPQSAQDVIACPHPHAAPARKMLEREGFSYGGYIDIFDGGPVLSVATDRIATLATSRTDRYTGAMAADAKAETQLLATGQLSDFRAWMGEAHIDANGIRIADAPCDVGTTVRSAPLAFRD